jgi:hypothetical protein
VSAEKMFDFDPTRYAPHFAKEGYVHIRGGVTESFYAKVVAQVEQSMKTKLMKEFAIGDKQQAMYEFPQDGGEYVRELCQAVGAVCGVDPQELVLSERHVKAYDADAASEPNPHKDRFASQISVGLSVHVKPGSTLVLYPYELTETNPFNTSVQLRASLSPERYPEPVLKKARAIAIEDAARDLIMFRGHSFWHLRRNPALTTMLYFKMNAFNCDPLGEDPRTPEFRSRTAAAVEMADALLEKLVPLIGRRVDHFHTHFNRDWVEVPGVVLWGEKHFTLDDEEMRMLKAIDGQKSIGSLVASLNGSTDRAAKLEKVRRLARRGVIDLVSSK